MLLLLLLLFACKQGVMVRAIVVGRLVGGGKTRFFVAVLPDYIYLGLGKFSSFDMEVYGASWHTGQGLTQVSHHPDEL